MFQKRGLPVHIPSWEHPLLFSPEIFPHHLPWPPPVVIIWILKKNVKILIRCKSSRSKMQFIPFQNWNCTYDAFPLPPDAIIRIQICKINIEIYDTARIFQMYRNRQGWKELKTYNYFEYFSHIYLDFVNNTLIFMQSKSPWRVHVNSYSIWKDTIKSKMKLE